MTYPATDPRHTAHRRPLAVAPELSPAEREVVDRFENTPDALDHDGESMPRLTIAEANAEVRAAVDHAHSLAPEDRPLVLVWADLTVTSGSVAHLGTHLAMIEHGYSDEQPVQALALYAGRLREVEVVREGRTPWDSDDYAYATYALRLRDAEPGAGAVVDRCTVRVDGRC